MPMPPYDVGSPGGNVIFYVGLPGSGKTTRANIDLQPDEILLDDVRDKEDLEILSQYLFEGCTVRVTDPMLCIQDVRVKAMHQVNKWGVKAEWIFFENNPEQCYKNLSDNNEERAKAIRWLTEMYTIPDGAFTLPVFSMEGSHVF